MSNVIWICVMMMTAASAGQTAEYTPPMLGPAPYLIRDPAVRRELKLTDRQQPLLESLCGSMDEHLFVLRDQPAVPEEPSALRHVQAVEKAMTALPKILEPQQLKRLEQLAFQYEGAMAMFRSQRAQQLQISPHQQRRMQFFFGRSVEQQEEILQRLREDGLEEMIAQEVQQVQFLLAQQLLKLLTDPQLEIWRQMLGEPFDFSQTRPLSFRAPELQGIREWIGSRPVSLEALRGRVVVVIFRSFANSGGLEDYPVYSLWLRDYNPGEVTILGIHVPRGEADNNPAAVQKTIEAEGLAFPVALDPENVNGRAWANQILPSVYLVDKQGRVRYWWYGPLLGGPVDGDQWVAERIEELRAERPENELRQGTRPAPAGR